jgi:hypothetical protein
VLKQQTDDRKVEEKLRKELARQQSTNAMRSCNSKPTAKRTSTSAA